MSGLVHENSEARASPYRRGGRAVHAAGAVRQWNTPASAGRTTRRTARAGTSPEDPRVGEEDLANRATVQFAIGTPSRRRGGPEHQGVDEAARRNTPASAGRTERGSVLGRGIAEHPRVGGENLRGATLVAMPAGTPPRWRGGPARAPGARSQPRTPPASAGRTSPTRSAFGRSSEHPRVGGEDTSGTPGTGAAPGTPPRRRGGPRAVPRPPPLRRNTPTSAGRTT